jgi:hypothetical protein
MKSIYLNFPQRKTPRRPWRSNLDASNGNPRYRPVTHLQEHLIDLQCEHLSTKSRKSPVSEPWTQADSIDEDFKFGKRYPEFPTHILLDPSNFSGIRPHISILYLYLYHILGAWASRASIVKCQINLGPKDIPCSLPSPLPPPTASATSTTQQESI